MGVAALGFGVVLLVFFAPALSGSAQFLFRDAGRMHFPVKRLVAEELRRGHLPEWNPYAGLGGPIVASAVDAVQHPFNVLLALLPFDVGFKLWVLLCYLAAALGTWAWATRLGASPAGAFCSGLAFALSGYLVSSSDNLTFLATTAAVPWLLAAAHAWIAHGGPGRLALLGCASAACAAGGDPQGWGLAVASLPAYAALLVARGEARLASRLARGAGAALACLVAAAPFILPVVAWLPHSSRADALSPAELLQWNLHPSRLLELGLPRLLHSPGGGLTSEVFRAYAGDAWNVRPWVLSVYVGASTLALAAAGVRGVRAARILVAGAVIATWMALGPYAGYSALSSLLPSIANFRYSEKLVAWPTLFLAVAAGLGVDLLAKGGRRRAAAMLFTCGALLLVCSAAIAAFPEAAGRLTSRPSVPADASRALASNAVRGLAASGGVLVALALAWLAAERGRAPRLASLFVPAIVGLDLVAGNAGAYVLSPAEVARPRSGLAEYLRAQPGLQRVVTPFPLAEGLRGDLAPADALWRWGAQTLAPAWNVGERIGNFEAYGPMLPLRADRHRRRVQGAAMLPTLGMWSVAYVVVPGTPRSGGGEPSSRPDVAAVDAAMPAALVRVPHRERAYLARELRAADRRAAMEFVLDPSSAGSDRSVVEGPVPEGYVPPDGEARIVTDLPERVVVQSRSDRPALLVLNDAFAAGWTARVDGATADIHPVNYLARGVWVGSGTRRVEFAYRTPLLREGWAIFLAGALALASAALARARRSRRDEARAA